MLKYVQGTLPLARADMRLDFHYGGDHTFPHLLDMLRAKSRLLRRELEQFFPAVETALRGHTPG